MEVRKPSKRGSTKINETEKWRKKQLECAMFSCRQKVDSAGFEVRHIDDYIGSGVFTTKFFTAGSYLLEYSGDLITYREAIKREKDYKKSELGNFLYFFKYNEKTFCVDPTNDIFSTGRMVNDAKFGDPKENVSLKIVIVHKKPHLCMFAKRDITKGEDLRFDYGVSDLPWRKKLTKDKIPSKVEGYVIILTSKQHDKTLLESVADYDSNEDVSEEESLVDSESEYHPSEDESSISNSNSEYSDLIPVQSIKNWKELNHHLEKKAKERKSEQTTDHEIVTTEQTADHEIVTSEQTTGDEIVTSEQTTHHETVTSEQTTDHEIVTSEQTTDYEIVTSEQTTDHEIVTSEQTTDREIVTSEQTTDHEIFISEQTTDHEIVSSEQITDHEIVTSEQTTDHESVMSEQTTNHEIVSSEQTTDHEIVASEQTTDHEIVTSEPTTDHKIVASEQTTDQEIVTSEQTNHEIDMYTNSELSFSTETSKRPNKIIVPSTSNTAFRVYDKKFHCLFCKKELSGQVPRHFRSQHASEQEVIEYMQEKDKTQRDKLYTKLRNIGNHIHNCDVIRKGEGILAVNYRPTEENANYEDYGPCPYCFGTYVRKELWRHKDNCPFWPTGESNCKVSVVSRNFLPAPSGTNQILFQIISYLRSDESARIVKCDDTILAFGRKLCGRLGHDPEQHNHIRQKLREMGRLLKELRSRSKDAEKSLSHFIDPQYFRLVVESSKAVALFNQNTNRYGTPSLALKLGQSLEKCTKIIISQGIELQDKDKQERAEEFMKLLEINWRDEVSSNAHKTLYEGKQKSGVTILPLADDVKMLSDYLQNAAMKHHDSLLLSTDINASKNEYAELSEIMLTQTILFNRRRSGEVSKMKVGDFQTKQKTDANGEITASLSEFEKKLCGSLYRIEIPGKRGRRVPVLLTRNMVEYIDTLIQKRDLLSNKNNDYLFARLHYNSSGHLRGSDSLRKYAKACGAQESDRLTSTKLRKHIATMSQLLNLKENELDILANFLGHDIRVHREFYRLPQETLQVAKVSKLLLQMEQGGQGLKAGQTLDSLNLDDNIPEEEMDESDIEDDIEESDEDVEPVEQNKNEKSKSVKKQVESVPPVGKRKYQKKAWTEGEKCAVSKHFNKYLLLGKLPGKTEIQSVLDREPVLGSRTWTNVKDFCRNSIDSKKLKK